MRAMFLSCIFMLSLISISSAEINKKHDSDKDTYETRIEDLKDQIYEVKYSLLGDIRSQFRIIREQEIEIVELKLKIKELEYELFQTTQSLRNLELEVWDMKESSNQKIKADD